MKELRLGQPGPAGSFMDVVFNNWADKSKLTAAAD